MQPETTTHRGQGPSLSTTAGFPRAWAVASALGWGAVAGVVGAAAVRGGSVEAAPGVVVGIVALVCAALGASLRGPPAGGFAWGTRSAAVAVALAAVAHVVARVLGPGTWVHAPLGAGVGVTLALQTLGAALWALPAFAVGQASGVLAVAPTGRARALGLALVGAAVGAAVALALPVAGLGLVVVGGGVAAVVLATRAQAQRTARAHQQDAHDDAASPAHQPDAHGGVDVAAVAAVAVAAAIAVAVFGVGDAAFGASAWGPAWWVCACAVAAIPLLRSHNGGAAPAQGSGQGSAPGSVQGVPWSVLGLALWWTAFAVGHAPDLLLLAPRPQGALAAAAQRVVVDVVVVGPAAFAVGLVLAGGPRRARLPRVLAPLAVPVGAAIAAVVVASSSARAVLLVLSVVCGVVGALQALSSSSAEERAPGLLSLLAVVVLGMFSSPWTPQNLAVGSGTALRASPVRDDSRVRAHASGYDSVAVVAQTKRARHTPRGTPRPEYSLENGVIRAGRSDDAADRAMAATLRAALPAPLPAAPGDRKPPRVLVLGVGTGAVAAALADGSVDVDVADAAAVADAVRAAWRRPLPAQARFTAERPRRALARSGVVDGIVVGYRHPSEREHALLTDAGFYALARARLAPGGVLVQRLLGAALSEAERAAIVANAQQHFSQVHIAPLTPSKSRRAQWLLTAR